MGRLDDFHWSRGLWQSCAILQLPSRSVHCAWPPPSFHHFVLPTSLPAPHNLLRLFSSVCRQHYLYSCMLSLFGMQPLRCRPVVITVSVSITIISILQGTFAQRNYLKVSSFSGFECFIWSQIMFQFSGALKSMLLMYVRRRGQLKYLLAFIPFDPDFVWSHRNWMHDRWWFCRVRGMVQSASVEEEFSPAAARRQIAIFACDRPSRISICWFCHSEAPASKC